MRAIGLDKKSRDRLSAILALAESECNQFEPERIAAIDAAEKLLKRNGMRLRNLAVAGAPAVRQMPEMGTWRETCRRCLERRQSLRPWEVNFLTDLPKFQRISAKQRWIVDEIAVRIGVKEARRPA